MRSGIPDLTHCDAEGRYRVAIDDIDTSDSGLPAIDRLLESARSCISPRVNASDLDAEFESGALVVDTRSAHQRARDGDLPGAIVIERNVLEWRLDPTSPHRVPEAGDPARRVVVVCDEGYASSLAAATLRDLGRTDVTDLDGGYQAWLKRRATR